MLGDLDEVHRNARLRVACPRVGVRRKVVQSRERGCSGDHRLHVEWITDPPDPRLEKRAADAADLIEVHALCRVVA